MAACLGGALGAGRFLGDSSSAPHAQHASCLAAPETRPDRAQITTMAAQASTEPEGDQYVSAVTIEALPDSVLGHVFALLGAKDAG